MSNGHAGSADWVQGILLRHEGGLTRYARRIVGDDERARDVVQETFLRLCREDRGKLDGHLVEWLYTVCRNKALDVRRKEQRMTMLTEESSLLAESPDLHPSQLAERRDSAGQILDLLDRLPANQQEAIRLKFQSGLSYREISEVTGLSISHVGVLIHNGLKTLRARLCVTES
ncbi:MAG TPA: sigma-70 family RNA polymerase sigma factor [Planctomycetaceae bacterium]|nr:sigma-70 family RNA polymerase sigma factor [Planctomycetaceae bacterium]